MSELERSDAAHAQPDSPPDSGALIVSLRAAGAHRFDPVRLHYIETLARRAQAHDGSARRMLDARLAQALAALQERFERAQAETKETVEGAAQQHPQAAGELRRLLDAGDFKGVRRLAASLQERAQGGSLAALARQLDQHAPVSAGARPEAAAVTRTELKTVRKFRNTWAKLSVDKQVAKALEQAPKNAGPINSHMLALRSLALMRDISPDYLNRFMTYADTLLCLDQGEKDKPALPKKSPARSSKK